MNSDSTPEPERLELVPDKIVFDQPNEAKQARVVAHYSDGSERDVSQISLYMTNNEAVATIDNQAKIAGLQGGGTHVFARFDKFTVGTEVVVLPDGKFEWPDTPEHNFIDPLVFATLRELRIVPSAISTDQQFLRRVTIDLTGKLPTPDEYARFVNEDGKDKREKLVDTLLQRDAFGEL